MTSEAGVAPLVPGITWLRQAVTLRLLGLGVGVGVGDGAGVGVGVGATATGGGTTALLLSLQAARVIARASGAATRSERRSAA